MTVQIRSGDVLNPDEMVVAHGCNTLGVMGAGFALTVRRRHPGAYDAYMAAYRGDGLRLGEIVRWTGPARTILHCMTQATIGRHGVHVDYDAVRSVMRRIEAKARHDREAGKGLFHQWPRVAMPRIGGRLGGGDSALIQQIVEDEIRSIEVAIYDFDPSSTR